ncbi:hypothetical protein I317_03236 [Kwoniella heveanensis CBS 569]|nr:hypothetical protein I317_03236 [Kwoniella heveanensis CBS 569]
MDIRTLFAILFSLSLTSAAVVPRNNGLTYDVQSGERAPIKGEAPVAVSLEFFAFPGYVQDLSTTDQCLKNLGDVTGSPTPVRIGGTTQDRATYDPTLTSAVDYTVASAGAAPATLRYGPSFFDLAGALEGPVTIGVNRRLNNINNSIAAAKEALQRVPTLYAFELGNEPDLYTKSDPIAGNQTWTPALDASIQISWQEQVVPALGLTDDKKEIIQGGPFLQPPKFSIQELAPKEVESGAIQYIKSWADHAYPQSACGGSKTNLETLQNHTAIVKFVETFRPEVDTAAGLGDGNIRPLIFGETNSATCGGGGISPTFGAALWLLDYTFQSVKLGYERLHFHQGTIGNSPYSWWGDNHVFAPYYGAYFAASAMGGMDSIVQLDDGQSELAVYAFYKDDQLSRGAIYNSVFFSNTTAGDRTYQNFTLTNLPSGTQEISLKRLTAPYTTSQQELGQAPTFGGQSFADDTCAVQGDEQTEHVEVQGGSATISVGASEAVLIYFK